MKLLFFLCQRGIAYAGNNMRKDSSSVQQQQHTYDTTEAYLTYKVGNREMIGGSSQQSTKRKVKASIKRFVNNASSFYYHYHSSSRKVSSEDKDKYPESRGLMSRQQHYA